MEMENEKLLWFDCKMESGYNIKGVSRVGSRKIKRTLENWGDVIKTGKYQDATEEQIKEVANEYGTKDIRKFMEETGVDVMYLRVGN